MLLPLMRLMTAQLALSGDLQRVVSAVHGLPEGFGSVRIVRVDGLGRPMGYMWRVGASVNFALLAMQPHSKSQHRVKPGSSGLQIDPRITFAFFMLLRNNTLYLGITELLALSIAYHIAGIFDFYVPTTH